MTRFLQKLKKPEYYFQPKRLISKVFSKESIVHSYVPTRAFWGDTIYADPSEAIGRSIHDTGLYDLSLTETVCLLLKDGDTVLDIGANIGYVSLLMSRLIGKSGSVFAFEPNPAILPVLESNIHLAKCANITCFAKAVSDTDEMLFIHYPDGYVRNKGLAEVSNNPDGATTSIEAVRLDDFLPEDFHCKLMKVDVEGHEANVFKGAFRLFDRGAIDFILFEENGTIPSFAMKILEEGGYTIFRIRKGWLKLVFQPYDQAYINPGWETTNFLAVKSGIDINHYFDNYQCYKCFSF